MENLKNEARKQVTKVLEDLKGKDYKEGVKIIESKYDSQYTSEIDLTNDAYHVETEKACITVYYDNNEGWILYNNNYDVLENDVYIDTYIY
jgi:hypothetical protein